MTEISGSLKLVTGSPAAVSQVWLRAPKGRVQNTAYVTESPDTVQVTGGAVSFDALPGAMVMTLVSHGSPMHTVKLLVPDKTTATLAECIEAAELATDGTRSALERLALEVQAELGQVPSLVSDALAQDSTIIDAVKQASVIREDTTVGTRVFAGDIMIYGDTGWRVIANNSTHPTTIGSGEILIRRLNSSVEVVIDNMSLTDGSLESLIPYGFRPVRRLRPTLYRYISSTPDASTQLTSGGYFNFYGDLDDDLSGSIVYTTINDWPTSLPGIPS